MTAAAGGRQNRCEEPADNADDHQGAGILDDGQGSGKNRQGNQQDQGQPDGDQLVKFQGRKYGQIQDADPAALQ